MKDFDALKDIWHGQRVSPKLDYEDVVKGIKKSGNTFGNKLLFEIAAMTVAILMFVYIWISSNPMMWTTHLSMLIFIACCLYYTFAQIMDYRDLNSSSSFLKEPGIYIAYLKQYKRKRYIFNTRKYTIYSIFIGLAFILYFIEIYLSSPLWQTITGILIITAWFFLCWYFMKIYIRKEENKLAEMITALEKLEKQFNE